MLRRTDTLVLSNMVGPDRTPVTKISKSANYLYVNYLPSLAPEKIKWQRLFHRSHAHSSCSAFISLAFVAFSPCSPIAVTSPIFHFASHFAFVVLIGKLTDPVIFTTCPSARRLHVTVTLQASSLLFSRLHRSLLPPQHPRMLSLRWGVSRLSNHKGNFRRDETRRQWQTKYLSQWGVEETCIGEN